MATSRHLQIISGVLTEVVTDLTGGAPSALYKVRTAGTGYSVDHTLMAIALVSQASPFTVSLKWVNLNTGLEVTPVLTHLQLISADVGQKTASNSLSVVLASDQALPLPTGAATAAKQPAFGTAGTAAVDVVTVQGIAGGVPQPVSGTFWQATQPISAVSLPLPTGAATAAKQPAFSAVGTSSPDVITIQGAAGAVAVPVSMSNVPLPTGAATAAKQPAFGTAGSAAADVVTIQGIAGGVSIPIAGNAASGAADSGNPVKVGGVYNTALPTFSAGQRGDLQLDSRGRLVVTTESQSASYSACYTGAVTATAPQDVFEIRGAAGKKITITNVYFNATQTTAGSVTATLIKRSTLNTAGTPVTVTAVPHSSGSPAASAAVRAYQANPTAGATVGAVRAKRVFVGTATSLFNSDCNWDFNDNASEGISLANASESLCVNLGGTNIAGNLCCISVEWIEE